MYREAKEDKKYRDRVGKEDERQSKVRKKDKETRDKETDV